MFILTQPLHRTFQSLYFTLLHFYLSKYQYNNLTVSQSVCLVLRGTLMSCNGILMSPDIICVSADVSECVCGEFVMIVVFRVSSSAERHGDFIVVHIHTISVSPVSRRVCGSLGGDLCFCVWSLISSCIICNDPGGTHSVCGFMEAPLDFYCNFSTD